MRHRPRCLSSGIASFARIRKRCHALREVVVPDVIWSRFLEWHSNEDRAAGHRSMFLLGMERGHLGSLTAPIHRFALDGDPPHSTLSTQYQQDLREDWMLRDDGLRRHHRFREFAGRLAELRVAAMLEREGWLIDNLEAWGATSDILAHRHDVPGADFEVKRIGVDDESFVNVMASFSGSPQAISVSPYDATNYLLLRVYEAARQLDGAGGARIAVIVIPANAWHRFDVQFSGAWIDWAKPSLCPGSGHWRAFIAEWSERHGDLGATNLANSIRSLDAVWIVSNRTGPEYRVEACPRCVRPVFRPADR